MKLVVAIIRREDLEKVEDVLKPGQARLLSIAPVENAAEARAGMYRGLEIRFRRAAVRLEIAVEDWYARTAVAEIARTVSAEDSEERHEASVFMMPLDACLPAVHRQGGASAAANRLVAGYAARSLAWEQ
jgi:nitrogen regulatory protein PII